MIIQRNTDDMLNSVSITLNYITFNYRNFNTYLLFEFLMFKLPRYLNESNFWTKRKYSKRLWFHYNVLYQTENLSNLKPTVSTFTGYSHNCKSPSFSDASTFTWRCTVDWKTLTRKCRLEDVDWISPLLAKANNKGNYLSHWPTCTNC